MDAEEEKRVIVYHMKIEHQNIEDDKWLKRQDEYSYSVSVVVVTYNPSWDKEKETLDSILK